MYSFSKAFLVLMKLEDFPRLERVRTAF